MKRRTMMLSMMTALVVAACGGSQWTVIRQATPNPLLGQRVFVIAPVQYDGLIVANQPEAQWLATRTPDQQLSFQNDKERFNENLLAQIGSRAASRFQLTSGTTPPANGFFLVPHLRYVHSNAWSGGEFHLVLEIANSQGQVVSEINIPVRRIAGYGLGAQLQASANAFSLYVVRYLREQTGTG